jgi:CubicO group peptidase (beta-lactamase class C family)
MMRRVLIALSALLLPLAVHAAPLSAAQKAAIDDSMKEWLARTGAPSVSIAVVDGNEIAYAQAYGQSRLDPALPATTLTRYPIGSILKQIIAGAVLTLQQDGELSLDDKVSKYFPDFTRANDITIRELLSHTSGYPDDAPQDYFTPAMGKPHDFREWAMKPLTFEPGTDWQYSSTGFKIAAAIVEKVSGQPLMAFLQARIFAPLGMTSVTALGDAPRAANDATGYARNANGPIRLAPHLAEGWTYVSGGELAMSASDLARWDMSVMNRSLLKPESYDALYTTTKLKNGADTGYSLGLSVWENHGRIGMAHDGGMPGATSETRMWPSAHIAVVALTNNSWTGAGDVAIRLANVVLPPLADEAKARAVFSAFQAGVIDRAMFTDNANAFLTPSVLADQKEGLAKLGPVRTFVSQGERDRGGFHVLNWGITTANATLAVTEYCDASGKVEQFVIKKAE